PARVVGRVDVASDQDRALNWLMSHDVREEAVVEGGRPLNLDSVESEAQIVFRAPDRMVVSARGPGLLVVSEVYERGWRASADGEMATIHPVDGVLRGVYLQDGLHEVAFVYDPPAIKVGVALSGLGVIGLLIVKIVVRRPSTA
ncbi:MAG TPA: YfhO family protein, partial [Anaerolineae bacterium]